MNIFHVPATPGQRGIAFIPKQATGIDKRSGYFNSHYGRILVDDLWTTGPYYEVLASSTTATTEKKFCELFWDLQDHPAIKRFVPLERGIAVLSKVLWVEGHCTTLETYYGDKLTKLHISLEPGDIVYVITDESHYWLSVVEAIKRF